MSQKKYSSPLDPNEQVSAEQLATDQGILAFDQTIKRLSRRRFLNGLSGATALMVGAGFLHVPKAQAQAAAAGTPSVADVLNFALNLEYLEANLYNIAVTGSPISTSLLGTSTPSIAGSPGKLNLDAATTALFTALAQDEINHINLLRSALSSMGATPISAPAINYAAKGAITTQAQLLATARQFTEVGNGAYQGSAMLLVSAPSVLQTAAQILGAEGQHLGAINYQIISQNVATAYDSNPMAHVDLLDQPPNPTQYFSVALPGNTAGLPAGIPAYRTPQQSLGIVYGVSTGTTTTPPAGVTSGGFLPSGANGAVTST